MKRKSKPTSLHINLNNEQYDYNLYDKDGMESDKIYFKGIKITPSFYLISEKKRFRVDFKKNKINIISINEIHQTEKYIKNNCSFISSKSTCWAISKFFTSKPEKPPFNQM